MKTDRARPYALAAGIAAVVALGVTGYFALFPGAEADPFADCRSGQVAGGVATIGGPFELVNGAGAPETDKEAITGPTLVYFGYSFCPDICPTDLSRNALAADELAEKGIRVGQVFISVDPARDTPEVVRDFTRSIHPDLIGLTGTPEQVARVARDYKIYYRKAGDDPETYLMDHSTFTYLMAPGGKFLEFYGSDALPEQVADSVACFAEKS
ncbi:SCO family protein [Amaricoccus solimangrovi]|uniref:SCO family protein n=1 Tax=Amaricoccus solimangrovi TaxID=2589815 RepID=A0A501WVH0_9RHOB|nr:SCO family protein [Amaricoccus solimangrovi]TPE52742.1 SCO family protein [Amaricoccus solimangrovi]